MRYFAGGNTSQGFCTRFDHILPKEQQQRMFYLKGGPGVGKSSLMKAVGKAAEGAGLRVEYFYCSSDPESLDGVSIPEKGAALMDGTAPHVYDPVLPGARDTLVSLGDFLDEKALRNFREELQETQRQISARFARCYHYLAAAAQVRKAACAGEEKPAAMRALLKEWTDVLPLRGGEGRCRQLFGEAFTPAGLVRRTEFPKETRRFDLCCPLGCHPDGLMKRLGDIVAARGLDRIELLDPLEPKHVRQLYLPGHDLLFGCAPENTPDALPPEQLFALKPREEERFDQNAYELLCQRAVEQLSAAKALHDRLEAPYIRCMDFLKWQAKLDRILEELSLLPSKGENAL